jgi:PAS domain S-box-containing protein
MPCFYLDILNGDKVLEDPDGQELADLDAAMTEAIASAQYLVAHGILRNEDLSDRSILVRDDAGETVASVPFRSTLPGTLSTAPLPGSHQSVFGESLLASVQADLERLVEDQSRALEEREQHLRDLLEALPAAIYMTDADGRITFYNEAAVALAGRRPEMGQDQWCVTWRLYQPDGTPLPHDQCPMAIALKENRPIRGVGAVAERPDGTRVSFMPFPTPLRDASGALVGGVNMLVDSNHRQPTEKRIGIH